MCYNYIVSDLQGISKSKMQFLPLYNFIEIAFVLHITDCYIIQ